MSSALIMFVSGVVAGLILGFFSGRWATDREGAREPERQEPEERERSTVDLHSVVETLRHGVIVVDRDERVQLMNAAARRLLQSPLSNPRGFLVPEAIPSIEVQQFIARVWQSPTPLEERLSLIRSEEWALSLYGAQGESGVIVVIDDVTHFHRLEEMRRDFVANVSHELRTPITSIKGFVETLLEGAMDSPDDARRFLQIISRQSERLVSIFEDLLTLARIEDGAERGELPRVLTPVREVLDAAVEICAPHAATRGVTFAMDCDPTLCAPLNRSLIEQAVANLIDNAIKYSEPGGDVRVRAYAREHALCMEVEDRGSGIEREHLPRIFERFYRVDRGRSRKVGGTGLGLAIVKHIAQAHGGYPVVDSAVGLGSTFRIVIPLHLKSEGMTKLEAGRLE